MEKKKQLKLTQQKRRAVTAKVSYRTELLNTFSTLGMRPWREKAWDVGKEISPKMTAILERQGFKPDQMTYTEARQMISEIVKRWDSNGCSIKQAKLLARFDYPTDVSFKEASQLIDAIAKNGWKRPPDESAPVKHNEQPAPAPAPSKKPEEQLSMF